MCDGCYREYGSPKIDNQLVRDASEAVKELYYCHGAGGGMHIVTDDWNLEDDSIDFCGKFMRDYHHRGPDACEIRVYELFKMLTIEERASALARQGY